MNAANKCTYDKTDYFFACTLNAFMIHNFIMKFNITALHHLLIMKSTCILDAYDSILNLESIKNFIVYFHHEELKKISNDIKT